jgi:cytochrome c-type biogenesis protein CcmH/NrfF
MKKSFLDFLERQGIKNINSRQLKVAFLIWILPLGTLWLGIYLIWMGIVKRRLKNRNLNNSNQILIQLPFTKI